MLYYSTNHISPKVSLKEALIHNIAPDGGQYMPEYIPDLPKAFLKNVAEMSIKEIGYVVANIFFGGDINAATIKNIIDSTFNYPVPVRKLHDRLYIMELFHGPTLTCKDFGARFMARLLPHILLPNNKNINVIVFNTGNTGSAVANGLRGVPGVNVFVLYPKGKLTRRQEAEFTSLGGNVHPLEVQGSIDDCQRLEKELLDYYSSVDNAYVFSANSINIIRIIPQIVYYFYGYAQIKQLGFDAENLIFGIPGGNLGNLLAGLMGIKMGLDIDKLSVTTNVNDSFDRYMHTGVFTPQPTKPTIAYSMDVGSPSNISRIINILNEDKSLRNKLVSDYSSDVEICNNINYVQNKFDYLMDPHTAVAFKGLQEQLQQNVDAIGLLFATAHPAKSLDAMTAITGRTTELPLQLTKFMGLERNSIKVSPTLQSIIKYTNKYINR